MAQVVKTLLNIFLYLLDVMTDWLNGAEQIAGIDFFDHFMNNNVQHPKSLNKSAPSQCPTAVQGPTLGVISIALSWLPGLVSIMAIIIQIKENKLIILARFVFWPLFVPFQM